MNISATQLIPSQYASLQTPYMLTDLSVIQGQCRLLQDVLPEAAIHYAYKALSDDEVVKAVDGLVAGYDVASVGEIRALLKLGVHPSRMVYSNPVKSEAAIAEAYAAGVRGYAFQSASELDKLIKHAPGSLLFLRLLVPDGDGAIAFSSKFGCSPAIAPDLLCAAQKAGFERLGLTFHVGSQSDDIDAWKRALTTCATINSQLQSAGIKLSVINLGGGFPVAYDEKVINIGDIARSIREAIEANGLQGISLLAEPGRFLVADSSCIVTSVIGREERDGKIWLYLDVGAFQAFVEIFEFNDFPYPVRLIRDTSLDTPAEEEYALTGPSCDSYDTLTRSIQLPAGIKVGDKLVIDKTGAYTTVYGSNFNGFPVPAQYYTGGSGDTSKTLQKTAESIK